MQTLFLLINKSDIQLWTGNSIRHWIMKLDILQKSPEQAWVMVVGNMEKLEKFFVSVVYIKDK